MAASGNRMDGHGEIKPPSHCVVYWFLQLTDSPWSQRLWVVPWEAVRLNPDHGQVLEGEIYPVEFKRGAYYYAIVLETVADSSCVDLLRNLMDKELAGARMKMEKQGAIYARLQRLNIEQLKCGPDGKFQLVTDFNQVEDKPLTGIPVEEVKAGSTPAQNATVKRPPVPPDQRPVVTPAALSTISVVDNDAAVMAPTTVPARSTQKQPSVTDTSRSDYAVYTGVSGFTFTSSPIIPATGQHLRNGIMGECKRSFAEFFRARPASYLSSKASKPSSSTENVTGSGKPECDLYDFDDDFEFLPLKKPKRTGSFFGEQRSGPLRFLSSKPMSRAPEYAAQSKAARSSSARLKFDVSKGVEARGGRPDLPTIATPALEVHSLEFNRRSTRNDRDITASTFRVGIPASNTFSTQRNAIVGNCLPANQDLKQTSTHVYREFYRDNLIPPVERRYKIRQQSDQVVKDIKPDDCDFIQKRA